MVSTETGSDVAEKPKSANQLKKEAAKAEKLAKFREKEKKLAEKNAQKSKEAKSTKVKKEEVEFKFATKPGDKKDVNCQLPNAYNPKYVESVWYDWWEREGFFKPEYNRDLRKPNPNGVFTVVIPPPNVTGTLHLGHALATSIEDTICRWHRMKGKTVLFNPGCDHAGIATQVIVEKRLKRERGLTRHDLGRENFVEEVWKWKNEKGMVIYDQLRKLGAGVDWDRACFMMDPKISRAVAYAFMKMHDRGVIYRSNRLVNWSCVLKSAISDIEVDKLELAGRTLLAVPGYQNKIEFGVLTSFAYPLEDSESEIIVATTRVETMLGDIAIAVHPEDSRYKHLIGKYCVHPFVMRKLPIVADEFVDMEFGTGAVKITPAHDHNDYEVAYRHNLPLITCITDDGNMSDSCGKFSGLKRFDAREAVLEALKEKGLYRDQKENPMVVPVCSRSKDVIEPILKAQWYVKCDTMAKRAMDAVATGDLRIIPDFHINTWNRWLANTRDWCISRQLWWGHRIPAYFVTVNDPKIPKGHSDSGDYWVSAVNEEEAKIKAAKKFGVDAEKISLQQDDDVLDTWFSSGMWPFEIFGWPDETADLSNFFPGTLLETGHDILFFWVARMVFMAQELTGKLPFKEVFLHAMIRDAHGRKMSKSLGNVIDPLDVIHGVTLKELNKTLEEGNLDPKELKIAKEGQARDYPNGIPECGTDALRFALISYTGQGRDINLDVLRVQGYRFFCNKIWQASKFVLMQLGDNFQPCKKVEISAQMSAVDKWILSRLSNVVSSCNVEMSAYNFHRVTTALYNFWLYDFCDVYIEGSKTVLYNGSIDEANITRNVLFLCAETGLRLLAPFMPFITEELWQRFSQFLNSDIRQPASICVATYPSQDQYEYSNEVLEGHLSRTMEIIKTVRSLRSDYDLSPKVKAELFVLFVCIEDLNAIESLTSLIATLTSSSKVILLTEKDVSSVPVGCAQITVSATCKIALAIQDVIDVAKELSKLGDKKSKIETQIKNLENIMRGIDYEKVPIEVRTSNNEKMSSLIAELKHLNEAVDALKSTSE